MKLFYILICSIWLLISVIPGFCEIFAVRVETKGGMNESKLIVSKDNLESGASEEIVDLHEFGIYKLMNYYYDAQKDILILNNYGGFAKDYNLRIIDLKQKKVLKDIILNTPEPIISIVTNPVNGRLYVSYLDDTAEKIMTLIFDDKYDLLKKTTEFRIESNSSYFSKDGKYLYLLSYDTNDKNTYLFIVNALTGDIIKRDELTSLAIKGEYARIRDGKEGKLLLEYRIDEKYEDYILYDPLEDKVLAKLEKVPWHVGDVYLDDSADKIIINDAKFVKVNNKTERQYTNKILVYSFSKKGKVKEIPIKKGSKIEAVKGNIYLKQDSSIITESLK